MKFSINTTGMYPNTPFEDAVADFSQRGFNTCELWTIEDDKVDGIRAVLDRYHVALSTMCPDFFILNDPAQHDAYEAAINHSIEKAQRLNCREMITQVGNDTGAPRDEQHAAIVAGLRRVAPILEKAGIVMAVEPLNDVKDHPGYYLTRSQEGFEIIREVNSPNVRLLFDVYHQVHMDEDVMALIRENYDLIAHFHVAGHPNRDEKLFDGGFDYAPVFAMLQAMKCEKYIGLELFPKDTALAHALLDDLRAKYR